MVGYSFEEFIAEEKHNKLVLAIGNTIVDNDYTIRQAAANLCISKTTAHSYIHKDLKALNSDLYDEVKTILNKHKKNRVNQMNKARRFK